jgi:hypothetical protein
VKSGMAPLTPALTGWLADPALAPKGGNADSAAAGLSSVGSVEYSPSTALAGATPAYVPALLAFVHGARWRRELEARGGVFAAGALGVAARHARVLALQARMLAGLPAGNAAAPGGLTRAALAGPPAPPAMRSHTLAFRQPSAAAAAALVAALGARGVGVDARGACARVGLGA